MSKESWVVWKLAPESDPEQRLIITSADGETEITGIIHDPKHAPMIAALPDVFAAAAKVVASWEGVSGGLAPAIRELKEAISRARYVPPTAPAKPSMLLKDSSRLVPNG